MQTIMVSTNTPMKAVKPARRITSAVAGRASGAHPRFLLEKSPRATPKRTASFIVMLRAPPPMAAGSNGSRDYVLPVPTAFQCETRMKIAQM